MGREVRWFYHPGYNYGGGLPLRQVHGFVLDKPRRIRDRLVAAHGVVADAFERVEPVDTAELLRVHTAELVAGLERQSAVARAVEVGALRWLPSVIVRRAIVAPQLLGCGGTLAALRAALDGAWAFNLSGGYHHARRALSHGFCLVNDVAVAVETVRAEGADPAVLVLDLDLHQGDGNADVFAGDARVFTASLHEESVFPTPKLTSDLDRGVAGYLDDGAYLEEVDALLAAIAARFSPDVVIYVAGTDPFAEDPLGTLQVTAAGLRARDERVARFCLAQGAALVATPAGGYAPQSPELSADGFAAMAALAREVP